MLVTKKSFFALVIFLFSSAVHAEQFTVEDAWVREAPPVSRVQAAYATFKNNQSTDIELVSATSPAFNKIEFHKTVLENGLSKMLQQTSIIIPAQGTATLKPEGMHMMLFNPLKPLRAGDKLAIQFTFSNGRSTTASFVVKKATGVDHHQHMHH